MSATARAFLRYASPATAPAPQIDIVVPVHNEAVALEASLRRLHRFLSAEFPFSWRIVVADNASTDATPAIAARLAARAARRRVPARWSARAAGRALRAAWSASRARVVCYMDVDLSTDLRGLLPLVAPLLSGHSDLAIGTRLAHGVAGGPRRRSGSSSRAATTASCTRRCARGSRDAQCGFKAVRRDVLDGLLDDVRDDGWFFDTELLVLAQRARPAHPRGAGRLDRRPRLARRHRAHRDRRPQGRRAAARRLADRALRDSRRAQHARLRAALPARCARRSAPALANALVLARHRRRQHRREPLADVRPARARAARCASTVQGAAVYVLTLALTSGALARPARPRRRRRRARSSSPCWSSPAPRRPSRATVALRSWVFARRAAGAPSDRPRSSAPAPAPPESLA